MSDDDKPFDLDAAVNEALAEHEAKEAGGDAPDEAARQAAENAAADEDPADKPSEEDTDTTVEGAEGGDAADDKDSADGDTDVADEPGADEPQPLDPPARWSAEDKEAFGALPREAQEIVLKRERDRDAEFTRKSQEFAEKDRRWERVEAVLGPRRQAFAMEGMSDDQALGQLFALSDFASRDPAGFVKWFAGQRQIDLASLHQQADGNTDPAYQALYQQIQALTTHVSNQDQARRQQAQAEVQAQIDAFKADPSHPHFEAVQEHMGALMGSGKATSLQDAYDQAVWANPDTRAVLMQAQEKAQREKAEKERRERAEKAKKAAAVNVKSKPADTKAPAAKDWKQTVDEVAGELGA